MNKCCLNLEVVFWSIFSSNTRSRGGGVGGRGGAHWRGGRLRLAAMQRILSSCSARPATSDRGAADLKGFAHCRRPLPCDYRSHVGCRNLFCCRLVVFSLLKCVLARSFLDVNFQVTFLTDDYDFGHGSGHFWYPKSVIWQAWCSTLAPWGTRGRSRGHLGAQERRPCDPGLHFYRFWVDFGTPF